MKYFMPNSIVKSHNFQHTETRIMLCIHLLLCIFSKQYGVLNKNKDCQTIKMVFQMNGKIV
jgi:hypothetical protein